MPVVTIYTDGVCNPNPGPGDEAAINLLYPELAPREFCGAEDNTTNNRMEVLAALRGLQALTEPTKVVLFTDSQYLCQGLDRHMRLGNCYWGLARLLQEEIKHSDLWQALAALLQRHQVRGNAVGQRTPG